MPDFEAAGELLLAQWPVLPGVIGNLYDWAPEHVRRPELVERLDAVALGVRYVARLQVSAFRRITTRLEERGIPCVLLKGAALRHIAYESPEHRSGVDIDFGVRSEHLDAVAETLLDLGFVASEWSEPARRFRTANVLLRRLVESVHYELGFFVRRVTVENMPPHDADTLRRWIDHLPDGTWHLDEAGTLVCYVQLDVHHGIFQKMKVDPILESSNTVSMGEWTCRVPSPSWALFHVVYKLYWEGIQNYGAGGHQFADVCRLVPRLGAADLDHFLALLARHRLEAGGYYVLRRLPEDFGVALPAALAEFVQAMSRPKPGEKPLESNDLGDMWDKVWGRR